MKNILILLLPLLLLVACDSPQKTIEALQRDIAAYSIESTPSAEEKIQTGFEKLDTDISKLNAAGKTSEAEALQRQVGGLRSQYETARLAGSLQKARNALEGFGQSVKNLGQQIGETFKPTPTPVSE